MAILDVKDLTMALLQKYHMGSNMDLLVKMKWGENPELKFPWFIRYDYQFVVIYKRTRFQFGAGENIWNPNEFFSFIDDLVTRTKNDFPPDSRFVRNFYKVNTGIVILRFKNQHDLIKARLGS